MTQNEQEKFIDELFKNVKEEVLLRAAKFPENWDGIELRWFCRDKFDGVVWGRHSDKRKKRYRDYENHCIVNNL